MGAMVHAYNCTKHDTTGYSPYFLMFGHHPRIIIDVALGRHDPECYGNYVRNLKEQLVKAYKSAEQNSRASQGNQKRQYDKKVCGAVLAPGDRVLICKGGLKVMQKLGDRLNTEVYVVIDQPNLDISVYWVNL